MSFEVFPLVYRANKTQRVNVKLTQAIADGKKVSIKLQPMEIYGIEHTPAYRAKEENRYPYHEAALMPDGSYSVEYPFAEEQKYSIRIKIDDDIIQTLKFVYAVADDIFDLTPLKADTHLHTCRSDGEGTPFEVGIAYRHAGFDFIAITDHHKMAPSVEAKEQFESLTDKFFVLRGEEVHNNGGYFHIINLGGNISVNEILEAGDGFAEAEIEKILKEDTYPEGTTPYICAFHKFVADTIRRGGGVSVMAHPFWVCWGEYHLPTADMKHLLCSGCHDALELIAGHDYVGVGNNLQVAFWEELLLEGIRIPVVGASDAHDTYKSASLFNKQFTIVFAKDKDDVLEAIKDCRAVAVERHLDGRYSAYGTYRLVKYARFLLAEYYPNYTKLASQHAFALEDGDKHTIAEAEAKLDAYKARFFA